MNNKTIFNAIKTLAVIIIFLWTAAGPALAQQVTVKKVGEWGSGDYLDIYVSGNYAYCAASQGGLDIIDIRNPAEPKLTGRFNTPGSAQAVQVKGKYAYIADGSRGLSIMDISNPSAPVPVGNYGTTENATDVFIYGDYAYVADWAQGFQIIDISNPRSPTIKGEYDHNYAIQIHVAGDYAYLLVSSGLVVVDVSDPVNPTRLGSYTAYGDTKGLNVKDNYVYITNHDQEMEILNVSNPQNPTSVGVLELGSLGRGVSLGNNVAYVATVQGIVVADVTTPSAPTQLAFLDTPESLKLQVIDSTLYTTRSDGMQIVDVTDTTAPSVTGAYTLSGDTMGIHGSGKYACVANYKSGLRVLDISQPSKPVAVGHYQTQSWINKVFVKGDYAYVTESGAGILIIDLSNPSEPTLAATYYVEEQPWSLKVEGNYLYLARDFLGLEIIDISNPSKPEFVSRYQNGSSPLDFYIEGTVAYIANSSGGLQIVDIANPGSPQLLGKYEDLGWNCGIYVKDNYAYLVGHQDRLHIVDVSDPANPILAGIDSTLEYANNIQVKGNYAYIANTDGVLNILDISDPANPTTVCSYSTGGWYPRTWLNNDYIYLSTGVEGKVLVLQMEVSQNQPAPHIQLSRTQLYFATDGNGASTGEQAVLISNSGHGTLDWTAKIDQDWLRCSPGAGIGSNQVFTSINTTGMTPGTYYGTLAITAPLADNSPQTVDITLEIFPPGQTGVPFGTFATPQDNTVIRSSVPFTGWVLDDIGVESVKLYRETQNNTLAYIGDATFVEGARPDVQAAYPGYPNNSAAGWGYMMLTNFLPDGDGQYVIHAIATDVEGHQVSLGVKTLTLDNLNAVKPFGAIDTPNQGGMASGTHYVNYGWVLTPLPNTVPIDGSTITVWIDGVPVGHPVYNQYRADVAQRFPGLNNTDGAVGYFYLDTTQYANGLHTIQWSAKDDAGNSDGIGSRYFSILNVEYKAKGAFEKAPLDPPKLLIARPGESAVCETMSQTGLGSSGVVSEFVVRKGFGENEPFGAMESEGNGVFRVKIKELEPLEIRFPAKRVLPLSTLPVGSTLDRQEAVFYWSPGHGFVGTYRLSFGLETTTGKKQIEIHIIIEPR